MIERTVRVAKKQAHDLINTPETFAYAYGLLPRWIKNLIISMFFVNLLFIYLMATFELK
jgi:hypothetical protein